MKKLVSLFFVLLLTLVSFIINAEEYPRGDVDQDGVVNISDVTCLIDNLLSGVSEGDVDQDGAVNISDVTCLIDYLLSGSWPADPVTPPDEGDWVDLGLPSGTLWATRNVGANSPEDYGDYFAWGETAPKSDYGWIGWCTYMWGGCDSIGNLYVTKYNTYSGYGTVDNKTELDPSDDAACAHYPGGRMPSLAQIQELCYFCSWQWTTRNGVNGSLVTGPNGNTMFLPAAGNRWADVLEDAGSAGYYWSRTLYSSNSFCAYGLFFGSGEDGWSGRADGYTVRAVRVSQN